MTRTCLALLAAALASTGCGSEDTPPVGSAFTVDFSLSKGADALVPCGDVDYVHAVQVRVLASDGLTPLPGWPKSADCAAGRFSDSTLPDGTFTLELVATGDLFDDSAATLFKLRRTITLPADRNITVSLAPEVAFLEVTWTFSTTGDLAPCSEIDGVSLFLGTGAAGSGSYMKSNIDCTAGRFAIPTPLLPQSFMLSMDAYARDTRLKLYDVTESRLLERGQNPPFAVVFRPVGGELLFDWRFMIGAATVMACDDPRVAVGALTARVTSTAGDPPIEATIPCAGQRPVRFPGARFSQGRALTLTLEGEGDQRFHLARPLVTNPGDTDLGTLTIPAVGTATITVTRTASTACPATIDALRVSVVPVGGRAPVLEAALPTTGGSALAADVPLGDYTLVVEGRDGDMTACRAEAPRAITGRSNQWEPIEL